MKMFFIKNMGCKSNQLEGALIEENLVNAGFEKAVNIQGADFFILNSCTVTHKSDNEAFYILAHAKKQNPHVKTVLTGCIAQVEREKLFENENIDLVLGNDEKLEISNFLINYPSPLTPLQQGARRTCVVDKLDNLSSFHKVLLTDTKKTRASLKIQDGCDNRCSYCIIPFARGKNRSADSQFILEQIKLYEQAGFNEIVLTGIHIGLWRENKNGLLFLLQQIEEKTSISRFRLGSLNPLEIPDEMLEFFKNSKKFAPHFHLSLQSMCDKTLKSMNRHYTAEQSLELIDKINSIYPLTFIGSDVIAGFAGETEEDFQTTVENLKKSKLTKIHVFPYSVRKGTEAEKFDCHLDKKTKDARAGVIKQISEQKYKEFLQKNLGEIQEVLIEKNIDKKSGCFKGVTGNYINVFIKPEVDFLSVRNTLQSVKIHEIGDRVYGAIV